jgi:hypothetical protein
MFEIKNTRPNPELIDAKKLIRGIGYIAIIFPFAVALPSLHPLHSCYESELLGSISAYYHTSSRNVFVGMICALAFCFFCYRGYSIIDSNVSNFAACCALGVAFIPTSISDGEASCLISTGSKLREQMHVTCAAFLFLSLAFFSIKIFTHREPNDTPIDKSKLILYRMFGYIILSALALIALYIFFLLPTYPELSQHKLIFWLEAVCLVSFGFSWLTKSGLFDRKN